MLGLTVQYGALVQNWGVLHSPSPEHTPGRTRPPLCPDPPSLGVPGVGVTAVEPLSARSCLAATPTHNHRRACLKMKVFVCCASSKFPPAHPGGPGRAGAARLAGGSPIPPGGAAVQGIQGA